MKDCAIRVGLTLCLSLAIPTFSQDSDPVSQATAKTVAAVYVQTAKGVNVYDATAAGKLTLVKGSPFPTSGQVEGVNGKYLISVGTTNVHSYAIASSGAVGKQASVINTQLFSGAECGTTSFNGVSNGAVLDHTGKYFYVQLYGALEFVPEYNDPICAAWQTYEIASNGELSFLGDTEYSSQIESCGENGWSGESTVPTISSSDLFAYGVFNVSQCAYDWGEFSSLLQDSFHVLDANQSFTATGPSEDPSYPNWFYYPSSLKADPNGHLAALLVNAYPDNTSCDCIVPIGEQLASYAINPATGAITSNNTYANMPSVEMTANLLSMSNSGKLIAVGQAPGLQIFHFNGAAPITPFSALLLPTVNIDQVAWDTSNHMYALSYSAQELYVYTVTPTTITAVGSYSVPAPYGSLGMTVVPK